MEKGSCLSILKANMQSNRIGKESVMCILQMQVQLADRFFEILPEEVVSAELIVENLVSHILLDLFDKAAVDEVTICLPSNSREGNKFGSIQIHVQCFFEFFTMLAGTEEKMKQALVTRLLPLLKELFGPVDIHSITISPTPWNYGHDLVPSQST